MTCLSRHTYLVPSVWAAGSLFPPVLPLPLPHHPGGLNFSVESEQPLPLPPILSPPGCPPASCPPATPLLDIPNLLSPKPSPCQPRSVPHHHQLHPAAVRLYSTAVLDKAG